MGKVNFTTHSTSKAHILTYTCADGRLFYYTKQKGNDRGAKSILNRLQQRIEEMEVDYKLKGWPLTKEAVKASLDKILHKTGSHDDIYQKMTEAIDRMESGKLLTPAKKKYSKGSIKTHRFTVEFLKKFGLPAHVTMDTYHKFITWCQEQDYSTNYIGSQIKNWKALFKVIGIQLPTGFKKIVEDAVDIYLSEEEIAAIFEHEIGDPKLALIRDWFVLDCYTGLRVSDLSLLSEQNYSKGFLTIANKKTDARVVIPAHPYVKKLRIKYKGFPPPVTSFDINKYIKSIARSAGIDQKVLHTITKGGRRVDSYIEKCQLITCHTARRSFITNLRKNGVPDTIVMKLTGIRSVATLKRYDKITPDEAAKIAAGMKFFK